MPPSSRGPGRSPFKAKTGVRISVEAQKPPQGGFFIALLGSARISVEAQKPPQGGFFNALLGSARISVEAQKPPCGGFCQHPITVLYRSEEGFQTGIGRNNLFNRYSIGSTNM